MWQNILVDTHTHSHTRIYLSGYAMVFDCVGDV